MTKLPDPRVEACAKASLIEVRARAISDFAKGISETLDPTAVEPEKWLSYITSMEQLLKELQNEIEIFNHKSEYGANE